MKKLLRPLLLLLCLFPSVSRSQITAPSAYLFVYFTGNEKKDESIHYALSSDGYHFWALNNNNPIISSDQISSTGGVRDPHILRSADGKNFYMAATDMVSANGWDSNRAMVLMHSADLIHWSSSVVNIQKKFSGHERLKRVWAPQTIYDEKEKKYMVYFSMKDGDDPDKIYYAYANKDFTDLESTPKQLFFNPHKSAAIDGDIIKHGGKFHLFFKTEGQGAGIKIAVSDSLTGNYVLQDKYIQQTNDPVEGAGVFKLNQDDGYILMYDLYTKGKYQFTYSKDLKNFRAVDQQVSMDFHPRHGTVLNVTSKEAALLMEKFYSSTSAMSSASSPFIKKNNVVIDSQARTVFFPLKSNKVAKNFDPVFADLPALSISPAPPYDLSAKPGAINVKIAGHPAEKFLIRAEFHGNPVLDGYYADPEIIYATKTKKFYIYPTSDGFTGWSGDYFKAFSSANLIEWKDEGIILDLKKDVSWAKRNAWAPTMTEKKKNGRFQYFYYFTAAQKIGVAISDNPTGPFKDSGKPLISARPKGVKGGQEIDPDVFTDPKTNKSYLYWGNGYMAGASLNADMVSIDTTSIRILTPDKDFREGTEVFYRKGKYYFLWSENDTRSENYRVRYGYANSPMGKIFVPENNLILEKYPAQGIFGTGHNSVIQVPGTDVWYIVYHRFTIPKGIKMGDAAGFNRETCIDRLIFDKDGTIKKVIPTIVGPRPLK